MVRNMDEKKVKAEIAKRMTESAKINAEARWYPIVVSAGLIGVIITLTKLFL